jgi:hypothetical protein
VGNISRAELQQSEQKGAKFFVDYHWQVSSLNTHMHLAQQKQKKGFSIALEIAGDKDPGSLMCTEMTNHDFCSHFLYILISEFTIINHFL